MNLSSAQPVGALLRAWRQRRRRSQLDLALEAEVSTRHLSCVETGRAAPSREMLLRLADRLEVPLRERNALLLAGGYAPMYPERALADPSMAAARRAVDLILAGHMPYPAIAVDRWWNLVAHNPAMAPLLAGVDPALLQPPVNPLRISLHPQGLAPLIINLGQWRSYLLDRLRRLVSNTGDPELARLLHELAGWPPLPGETASGAPDSAMHDVVALLRVRSPLGELALFSTITVFGTPIDITLSELALEAFYPADAATAGRLQQWAAAG